MQKIEWQNMIARDDLVFWWDRTWVKDNWDQLLADRQLERDKGEEETESHFESLPAEEQKEILNAVSDAIGNSTAGEAAYEVLSAVLGKRFPEDS